jgi:hypothetical protein
MASPECDYRTTPPAEKKMPLLRVFRFRWDIDELRTYRMDIRQVLSDNPIKGMLYEEDLPPPGELLQ